MKYSSSGWTAQMPQVFCGSTKERISVFHAAQRSLKSPPPGRGTAFQPRGIFSASQFVISERLAISKPAFRSACATLGAADLSREPLLVSLHIWVVWIYLFMNLSTSNWELKLLRNWWGTSYGQKSFPADLFWAGKAHLHLGPSWLMLKHRMDQIRCPLCNCLKWSWVLYGLRLPAVLV